MGFVTTANADSHQRQSVQTNVHRMPSGAYHDVMAGSGSIERGNQLGDRSSVRQSRYFRQYESGNAVKSILGTDNLRWDENKKEGVFAGHAVYDGSRQEYHVSQQPDETQFHQQQWS